jgi:N-acyl-D-amino-acid deacylase
MADGERFDLLVRNATIIDGTGAPRFAGGIGIRDGKLARIGELGDARGGVEIDATGRVAAPGFIDSHTHDDRLLLSAPEMAPKVSQGVTTVITGNCGISLACTPPRGATIPPLDLLDAEGSWFRFPTFDAYCRELAASPAAVNAACFLGHTTLRCAVMDDFARAATPAEVASMRALAGEALAAGAIGISTGTAYAPAAAAPTEELIEICRPLPEHGGTYVTHMRNEDERVLDAIEETCRIGRELGVPVVISHHKTAGTANHGRSAETLELIRRRMAKQRVGLDCYPYVASSTVLRYDRLEQSSRVIVTWSRPHPEFSGLDLEVVARRLGVSRAEAVERIKPAGAIYFMLDERDVQRILAFDETMIGSDGLPHDAKPHPRLWGTFPRVLGHYARELKLFSLETAVRKMTGLPAATFHLSGRGTLEEGNHADVTIFDPGTVADTADFQDSTRPARGIEYVIVNGEIVWRDGLPTGKRPGRLLRNRGGWVAAD